MTRLEEEILSLVLDMLNLRYLWDIFKTQGKFCRRDVDLGVLRTKVKIETMGMDGAIREKVESGKNQGPSMRYWSTPTC